MNDDLNRQLEAYLDGLMSEDEERRFRAEIGNDSVLADVLRSQEQITASLRRSMSAPACEQSKALRAIAGALPATIAGSLRPSLQPARSWLRVTAIAAVLALSMIGAWSAWVTLWPRNPSHIVRLSPEQYYQRKVNTGSVPYWKCESAEQFTSSFQTRFGQPLMLRAMPANISASGIDYSHTLSNQTMVVLMKADDKPIIVLVDRADQQQETTATPSCGLFTHRRQIGDLVLLEVSPLDRSQVLDLFFNPDIEHPTDVNTNWK